MELRRNLLLPQFVRRGLCDFSLSPEAGLGAQFRAHGFARLLRRRRQMALEAGARLAAAAARAAAGAPCAQTPEAEFVVRPAPGRGAGGIARVVARARRIEAVEQRLDDAQRAIDDAVDLGVQLRFRHSAGSLWMSRLLSPRLILRRPRSGRLEGWAAYGSRRAFGPPHHEAG